MSSGYDVAIIGAGPVGLTLSNFAGRAGLRTVVVEQSPTTSDEPRAVNLDDESLRTIQALGLADQVGDTLLPAVGTKYISRSGRQVAYAHPKFRPQGHWPKNVFVQPDFDALLARQAASLKPVDLRFDTGLVGLDQDEHEVMLELERGDRRSRVRASWVVGCDGGRSTVRDLIGVSMTGSTFKQPWIVLDVLDDPNRSRYSRHHLDPARPYVVVPGRSGRCRYEFMLLSGEDPDAMLEWESIRRLLAPHRAISSHQVIRSAVYTFHALCAERWKVGRVLLAGDAAHMMPPMAGQGLNSGIRDAHNLSWKLDLVVRSIASPPLLDTYEAERKEHAEAMIRLSSRMGRILMTTSRLRSFVYRALFEASRLIPPLNRYVSEMRFKPPPAYHRGFLQAPTKGTWIGRLMPQPTVMEPDGRFVPLDDVLGNGFALVGVDTGLERLAQFDGALFDCLLVRRIHVALGDVNPLPSSEVRSVADVDERLAESLSGHIGDVLLVRPDRYVAASCAADDPGRLEVWLATALGRFAIGRTGLTSRREVVTRGSDTSTPAGPRPPP